MVSNGKLTFFGKFKLDSVLYKIFQFFHKKKKIKIIQFNNCIFTYSNPVRGPLL